MMKTVKHSFLTISDRGGDFARTVGSDSADLARRFGSGTAGLARRIGMRRGLIGLAVVAAAVGGSIVLLRYLRTRNALDERDEVAGGLTADRTMPPRVHPSPHAGSPAAR